MYGAIEIAWKWMSFPWLMAKGGGGGGDYKDVTFDSSKKHLTPEY